MEKANTSRQENPSSDISHPYKLQVYAAAHLESQKSIGRGSLEQACLLDEFNWQALASSERSYLPQYIRWRVIKKEPNVSISGLIS